MNHLSDPIKIRNKVAKNRILMPPMVCFNWANEEGVSTVDRREHYGLRAKNDTAVIVIEAAGISKESRIVPTEIGIWDDKHIPQYQEMAHACHEHNSLVLVQIVHAGAKAYPNKVKAPSLVESNKEIEVLTLTEIEAIKDDFVQAAIRAEKAGLDGVEVHGAHNYLLNQFTSPKTNKRLDKYGGAIENRYQLSVDIVKAIRSVTSDDFIIGYRFGVNDPTFSDDKIGIKLLEEAGVDIFNVSSGIDMKSLEIPANFPGSFIAYMGYQMKQVTSKPVASVFDIRDAKTASAIVEGNYTDFVAIGRGLLADPAWARKALNNLPINTCYHCKPRCKFTQDGHDCPWYGK